MDLYERLGRLQEKYDNEVEQHINTIAVLRALKQGELTLDQVYVDPAANAWSITPRLSIVVEDPDDDGEADASEGYDRRLNGHDLMEEAQAAN